MIHLLKRHPIPIAAFFERVLVVTYAYPREVLAPLLPPGLELDAYEDFGFLAIAMVQTKGLRPAFLPAAVGKDFFLTGYRIFTRFKTANGQVLRGLKILRSDTDQPAMVRWGNLLTHYQYRLAQVATSRAGDRITFDIRTPNAEADFQITADLGTMPAPLPAESPFPSLEIARRFAGPLPNTFDYESESNSIIVVRGVRQDWKPQPVSVTITKASFLDAPPFNSRKPRLANAFYLENVPYRWERGTREALAAK